MSSIEWFEIGDSNLVGLELIKYIIENVKFI